MFIVYKDETLHVYDIETDPIFEIHDEIRLHLIGNDFHYSIRHEGWETYRQYSRPLADVKGWGFPHVLYGGVDTTETGKSYIKALFLSSRPGNPVYEMNDSTKRDTVVNYAIATNLLNWSYERYLAIATSFKKRIPCIMRLGGVPKVILKSGISSATM
jgi:hypothetical protein